MSRPEKSLSQLLDRKIKAQIIFYSIIFLVLTGIVAFRLFKGNLGVTYSIIGFILGILTGIFATRIFRITWDDSVGKVVARLDALGIIIFLLSIGLEIIQEKYLGYFIHGQMVLIVSFAVFAGVMLGRLLGIRKRVLEVLRAQSIVE